MNIRTRLINNMPSGAEMTKQVNFGTALGLTNTAKEAQKAVVKALGDTFTLRGQWFLESNKYGIRVEMATPKKQYAVVKTAADWLEIHEKGGDKTGRGGHRLGIPVTRTGPNGEEPGLARGRNKTAKITAKDRVQLIRDNPRSFIIKTKNGDVLFQRKYRGKRSKIVALYNLEPKAKIEKHSTFYEPIKKVAKERMNYHIRWGIMKAFQTAGRKGRSGTGRIGN